MLEFKTFKDHVITNELASHCGRGINISLTVGVNITSGKMSYTVKDKGEQVLLTPDLLEALEKYNDLDK